MDCSNNVPAEPVPPVSDPAKEETTPEVKPEAPVVSEAAKTEEVTPGTLTTIFHSRRVEFG